MTRAKKPKLPPSPTPHECVIVAVDPGENSGWSIWNCGELASFGECDVFGGEPSQLLQRALMATREGMPVVLVVERPFSRRIGSGGFDTTNVGAADKVWRVAAQRSGLARRIVRVFPAQWRAAVLGAPWHMAKREAVRAHEQGVARAMTESMGFAEDPGDDACPAILIGRWAAYAGQVGAVLPKRRKKAA